MTEVCTQDKERLKHQKTSPPIHDVRKDLLNHLPEKQNNAVCKFCHIIRDAGFSCYIIGGAVRDLLRGKKAEDVDFTTDARPEEVQKIFHSVIPTGIQHGTLMVRLGGFSFEITTFRSEKEYSDSRRPDQVWFSTSLEEDLKRRDFTINSIAYDPLTGELFDPHGGMQDIQKQILQTVGKAEERFYEDGLRPIRACRFAAYLGFDLETKTRSAFNLPSVQQRCSQIAPERLHAELEKGLSSRSASRMIQLMEESGLIFLFYKSNRFTTSKEDLNYIDQLYPASPWFRMAYWRFATGSSSREELEQWAQDIRCSSRQKRDIHFWNQYFHFQKNMYLKMLEEKKDSSWKQQKEFMRQPKVLFQIRYFLSSIKATYRNKTKDFLSQTRYHTKASIPYQELLQIYQNSPLIPTDLKINGNELQKEGISKGYEIGQIIQELLDRTLHDPKLNQKETLLKIAKEWKRKNRIEK